MTRATSRRSTTEAVPLFLRMLRLCLVFGLGVAVLGTACSGVSPAPIALAKVSIEEQPGSMASEVTLEKPLLDPSLSPQSIASRMAWAAMYVVDHCPYAVVEHRPARSRVTIVFGRECVSLALGPIIGTLEMTVSKSSEQEVEIQIDAAGLSVGGYGFPDGTWFLNTFDGKTYRVTGAPLALTSPKGASSFERYVSSRLADPSLRDPLLDAVLRTPIAVFLIASTQIEQ